MDDTLRKLTFKHSGTQTIPSDDFWIKKNTDFEIARPIFLQKKVCNLEDSSISNNQIG